MIEGGSQRVHVGPEIKVIGTIPLLGTHIIGCSHDGSIRRHGSAIVKGLGETHVHQFRLTVLVHDNVGRFDIAMDHVVFVPRISQRQRHLANDLQGGHFRHDPGSFEARLQRLPANIGHGQIVNPGIFTRLVGRDNVGVLKPGAQTHLVQKAFHLFLVRRQGLGQDFDGDVTIHRQLAGKKHFSHSSLAQQRQNLETANRRARLRSFVRHCKG